MEAKICGGDLAGVGVAAVAAAGLVTVAAGLMSELLVVFGFGASGLAGAAGTFDASVEKRGLLTAGVAGASGFAIEG